LGLSNILSWPFIFMKDSKEDLIKLRTGVFIFVLCLFWLALFWFTLQNNYFAGFVVIIFWGVLQFTLESFSVKLKDGASSTVGFSSTFAAILLFGPLTAGIVALFQGITWQELANIKKINLFKLVFNTMQSTVSAIVSGLMYKALGGLIFLKAGSGFTFGNFPSQILPLIFAIGAYYLTNTLLVSLVIFLNDEVPIRKLWQSSFSWGNVNYIALGLLGIALAEVYHYEPFGVVLLIVPLIIAQRTFSNYMELENAYSSTVGALITAIEAKDPYTKGHSERVAELSVKIAKQLSLPANQIEDLRRIASLHDIGKIGIPKRILLKPDKLSDKEFKNIQEHPRIGARILKDVNFLQDLIPAVYYHHEKMDGSGYNSGLKGKNIPLFARIIALADSYDAMTSDRAYRKALTKEEVVDQLTANAGTQFDNSLVQAFLQIIDSETASETQQPRSRVSPRKPIEATT